MATPEEIRRARENTAFGGLLGDFFAKNRAYRNRLAQQGRRPVLGGLMSKEPVMGTDTLRYEGFRPLLGNLLEPVIKGADTVRASKAGLIPQQDMLGEAFGAAGAAMLGGGFAPKPSGSLGANTLRVYHGGPKRLSASEVEMRSDPEGTPIGFSVTDNPNVAEYYRNMRGGGSISEFDIDLDKANIISERELYRFIDDLENKLDADVSYEQIQRGLLDAGVDAIEYPDPEFGIRVVNPNILSANRSRAAGVLATIGDNGGPPLDKPLTKEQLDPLGYQKTKMRRPFSEVEVQQSDLGENLARKPMNWEDMEGRVILPFYGDRTSRGLLVEGVNDYKFDAPVYTEGGVDFKVGPAAQKDRAIWASNQNIITRLSKEADKAQRDFGGRDILGVTGSMAPDANDFATFTGEAAAELVKGAKITKKTAREFDATMKALDPTFVGLLSPDLRDWVRNTSSPNRKSFIRLMDSRPMQDAGLPSPAEVRKSVTDPTQYELPAGMFGLGVSRIDTSAPLRFNTPKGDKPATNVPHSTYNTQITGDYIGSLRPVPQRLIFKDVYDAISGKLDKRGNPLTEANMTHAIKTKMPAQELTPQIIDGILNYLARQER
jgi:hypothetical protein